MEILTTSLIISVAWFVAGGVLYMNPFVAKIYDKNKSHPSMKNWSTQGKFLIGTFFVAGFIPILLTTIAYQYIKPLDFVILALILIGVRIIPRACDAWMQTSYPNVILLIELINGAILSVLIAYFLTVL